MARAAADRRFRVPRVQLGHGRVLVAQQRLWRRLLRCLLLPGRCHALLLPAHVPEDFARVVAAPGAPQDGDVAPRHHAHHCLLPATGVLVSKAWGQLRIRPIRDFQCDPTCPHQVQYSPMVTCMIPSFGIPVTLCERGTFVWEQVDRGDTDLCNDISNKSSKYLGHFADPYNSLPYRWLLLVLVLGFWLPAPPFFFCHFRKQRGGFCPHEHLYTCHLSCVNRNP